MKIRPKVVLSYLTLLSYMSGLTACKTSAVKVPSMRPLNNVPTGEQCLALYEPVRPLVDPATLVTTRPLFAENFVGDFQQLEIIVDGLHPASDLITYYQALPSDKTAKAFDSTAVLSTFTVPVLAAGIYRIMTSSCVDPDRVSAADRSRYNMPPTATAAGYVEAYDVYCGPLVEAQNSKTSGSHFKQDGNAGREEMARLLTAAFNARKSIENHAKSLYQAASEYHSKQKPAPADLALTEDTASLSYLWSLTAQILAYGKHGYALMVLSDYEETFNKTNDTIPGAKTVPGEVMQLIASPPASKSAGSCRSIDDYENTQTSLPQQIDYTGGKSIDEIFADNNTPDPSPSPSPAPSPTTSVDPNKPIPTTSSPNKPDVPETYVPLKDESGKKAAGIAMLSLGSVLIVSGASLAIMNKIGVLKKAEAQILDAELVTARKSAFKHKNDPDYPKYVSALQQKEIENWGKRHSDLIKTKTAEFTAAANPSSDATTSDSLKTPSEAGTPAPFSKEKMVSFLKAAPIIQTNSPSDDSIVKDRLNAIDSTLAEVNASQGDTLTKDLDSFKAILDSEKTFLSNYNEARNLNQNKKRLDAIEAETSLKNLSTQKAYEMRNYIDSNPKILRGALAAGAVLFFTGLITVLSLDLTDNKTPASDLLNRATNHGLNIINAFTLIHKINDRLVDVITVQ